MPLAVNFGDTDMELGLGSYKDIKVYKINSNKFHFQNDGIRENVCTASDQDQISTVSNNKPSILLTEEGKTKQQEALSSSINEAASETVSAANDSTRVMALQHGKFTTTFNY